jgi:hypothetical protein
MIFVLHCEGIKTSKIDTQTPSPIFLRTNKTGDEKGENI